MKETKHTTLSTWDMQSVLLQRHAVIARIHRPTLWYGFIALFAKKQVSILMDYNSWVTFQGQRHWSMARKLTNRASRSGTWPQHHPTRCHVSHHHHRDHWRTHRFSTGMRRIASSLIILRPLSSFWGRHTWPELMAAKVDEYLIALAAMIKGHLEQQRKNIWSTKPKD